MNEIDKSRKLRTAYITFGSRLIGKTIGSSTFEKDNNLVLAAVARRGERIKESPRQVVLQAGDTLLLVCPKNTNVNTSSLKDDIHFFDSDVVTHIGSGTLVSTTIMIAMVALSALGIMPLLQCAFLAAAAMLICRCCNVDQAMRAVNWEILMVFAGSAVLGLAIQKTGIAERLALGILVVITDKVKSAEIAEIPSVSVRRVLAKARSTLIQRLYLGSRYLAPLGFWVDMLPRGEICRLKKYVLRVCRLRGMNILQGI